MYRYYVIPLFLLLFITACDQIRRLPDCDGSPPFSVSPIRAEEILSVVPLGSLNPGGGHVFPTPHVYFYIAKTVTNDLSGNPKTVDVFAPGNLVITMITAQEHITDGYIDYGIRFSCCPEVGGYFGHIQSLSPKLAALVGVFDEYQCQSYTTGGKEYRNCTKEVSITVSAGETIGTAGRLGQNALDFGLYDARTTPLTYANPDRVESRKDGFDPFHLVCPIDYFTTDMKALLESRLGNANGGLMRRIPPLCGAVAQDLPGTAQGRWFVAGSTSSTPEDPHLALVHDNVDPERPVFSVGASIIGLAPGVYAFSPAATGQTNRDFSEISDTAVYCFNGFENASEVTLMLQLTSPTTLTMESRTGFPCDNKTQSFTENAVFFER